jgi:hypothetical protein
MQPSSNQAMAKMAINGESYVEMAKLAEIESVANAWHRQ